MGFNNIDKLGVLHRATEDADRETGGTQACQNQPSKSNVTIDGQAASYWRQILANCECASFPELPSSVAKPAVDCVLDHPLPQLQQRSQSGITTTTIIHAAWALITARMTNSRDVVFGTLISDLHKSVVQSGAAHSLTAPVRIVVPSSEKTVGHYLQAVEQQSMEMNRFERMGLDQIAKLGTSEKQACQFQTLLEIRPEENNWAEDSCEALGLDNQQQQSKNMHALKIKVQLRAAKSIVRASFDSRVIKPWMVKSLLERFESLVIQLQTADIQQSLSNVVHITQRDKELLWSWNSTVTATVDRCIHEVVEEQALLRPEAPAMCGWDGSLTYAEMNSLVGILTNQLVELGVGANMVVPLYFEKSIWTTIAMFGVLKAGAGFVLLDQSLPDQRLLEIIRQVQADLVLCSPSTESDCSRLTSRVFTVDAKSLADCTAKWIAPRVDPSSIAYVIFTSGSMGTPKGVVIDHQNVTSAVPEHIKKLGYTRETRIYDFASYSFGASLNNTFAALLVGGCLCVPSDNDRRSDLAGSLQALRATSVLLTPTVAESLAPEMVPSLHTLILGGEAVRPKDVLTWWGKVTILTAYGSSEVTTIATVNTEAQSPDMVPQIGKGAGGVTWVVDPDDHNILLPPGCIGELLLEGPLVGQGYLNDPKKTMLAFIEDPEWLLRGAPPLQMGRRGRLYKTGDLVRYNENGNLSYIGRKDAQVKIRGQRVELGEVEFHAQQWFPEAKQVVAEVVKPGGKETNTTIAIFIQMEDHSATISGEEARLLPARNDIEDALTRTLPSYMVPTMFFSMAQLPMTATGKMNRRQLRDIGGSVTRQELADLRTASQDQKRKPTSELERQIQALWAQALNIDPSRIGLDDTFFSLGGDSVSAMQVVSAARSSLVSIRVVDILRQKTIYSLAQVIETDAATHPREVPTRLCQEPSYEQIQEFQKGNLAQLGYNPGDVEDYFPCAPIQEGMLLAQAKNPESYQRWVEIEICVTKAGARLDEARLQRSWEAVVQQHALLRAVIINDFPGSSRSMHMILRQPKPSVCWNKEVRSKAVKELPKYGLQHHLDIDFSGASARLRIEMNHAIIDGFSQDLLCRDLKRAYQGTLGERKEYKEFIAYLDSQPQNDSREFWSQRLSNVEPCIFPKFPAGEGCAYAGFAKVSDLDTAAIRAFCLRWDVTPATIIKVAWGLVLIIHTGVETPCFGNLLSGRDIPVHGVDEIFGPVIGMKTCHFRADQSKSALDTLREVQDEYISSLSHQHFPLADLHRALGLGSRPLFNTALSYQKHAESSHECDDEVLVHAVENFDPTEYDVGLDVVDGIEGIQISLNFMPESVSARDADRLADSMKAAVSAITTNPFRAINELGLVGDSDLRQIWQWNSTIPTPAMPSVRDTPTPKDAISLSKTTGLVTWIVDSADNDRLVPVGCVGELLLEGPGAHMHYLNDSQNTAPSFVEDPIWLLGGGPGRPGRHGRLYKTGDLVRYGEDGTILFVSKKDMLVRICGQRVDLAEVAQRVLDCLPQAKKAVAEVIKPRGTIEKPVLACFLEISQNEAPQNAKGLEADVVPTTADVEATLAKHFPTIQTVLFSMSTLPHLPSGETDRERLRIIGENFTTQELDTARTRARGSKRKPTTDAQRRMQRVWSSVLSIEADSIGLDDHFFHLGGDSLSAMKLVAEARAQGLLVTVVDVFRHPKLHEVVEQSRLQAVNSCSGTLLPFALLETDIDAPTLTRDLLKQGQLDSITVEDAYPCTPLQQGLFSLSLKRPGDYVIQFTLRISPDIDTKAFCDAWELVAESLPILRTRIVQHHELGLLQVVCQEQFRWTEAVGLEDYLDTDRKNHMEVASPLSRYALVKNHASDLRSQWFVWTVHHVLYDGWCEPLIIDAVRQAYKGDALEPKPQFQSFIQYVQKQDDSSMIEYWRQALAGCESVPFPPLPPGLESPIADSSVTLPPIHLQNTARNITISTMIRAAWALVLGGMTDSDDVVFGVTLSGRNAPVAGIEEIIGPTFTTAPLRVRLPGRQKVSDYLESIQQDSANMIPFEQMGLHRIARLSPDCQRASSFQTLLVVQHRENTDTQDILGHWELGEQFQWINAYGLILDVQITPDGTKVTANFDSRAIDTWTVNILLQRLGHVTQQLDDARAQTLDEVSHLTPQELQQIWTWNLTTPNPAEQFIHGLMEEDARETHKKTRWVPWLVDPESPSSLSPLGCTGELLLDSSQVEFGCPNKIWHASGSLIDRPKWLLDCGPRYPSRMGKLHRTGHLVRYNDGGSLTHMGRKDDRAKNRGQKLVPEEVEAQVKSISPTETATGSSKGRNLATTRTPGLVTKRQPTSEIESKMQGLWARALEIEADTIGLDDSFFRLGGDSIVAMKLVGQARVAGLTMTVGDIFNHPGLHQLAKKVVSPSAEMVDSDTVSRTERTGPVEQSFAQARLWFLEQLYPSLTWYHIPFAIRLRGCLKLNALHAALLALEKRHDTLRTTFATLDGVSMQEVHPFRHKDLKVIEVSDEKGLQRAINEFQTAPFRLETEPGWRVCVYRLGPEHHILSIVMHHIVSDGWSVQILSKELAAFYSDAVKNREPRLQPLAVQYRDFSVWQRRQDQIEKHKRQLEYWVRQLDSSQPAELPCDKTRPTTLSGQAAVERITVKGELYERLQRFCSMNAVTPFVVLLAAFRTTHMYLTGSTDALIGTANANRDRSEIKDIIGFFVNMQCLRIKIETESFEQLVKNIQATMISAFANQDVPFDNIVSALRSDVDLSKQPLTQIVLAMHSQADSDKFALENLDAETIPPPLTTRFDLEFHWHQEKGSLTGQAVFSTDLFEAKTIQNMLSVFHSVLETSLCDPEIAVTALPIFKSDDYTALKSMDLIDIHRSEYPRDCSIADLFRQQVARTPDKVAVKDCTDQLTYEQLDQKSEKLALWLTKRSYPPESLIGVFSARSCETVIAFLGILKANLAYLPFDTKIPRERMIHMMASMGDHRLTLLGTNVEQVPVTETEGIEFVGIADAVREGAAQGNLTLPTGPSPTSLAYVVFTSGSSGKPKGVQIEHRGVIRLVKDSNFAKNLPSAPTIAHMTNIAWDVSGLEVYSALLNGGTLVCLSPMTVLDHSILPELYAREKVDVAILPPALLKQYLTECSAVLSYLNTVIVGGDKADPQDMLEASKLVKGIVINAYGPTENTVVSTFYRLSKNGNYTNGVPIGRALSNSGAYIMDQQQRLVPIGVVGELVVTGDGVARGYIDPKRNEGRFVMVDIGTKRVRAYRTGDYVRYDPIDGQMRFLGRMDDQIQVRGHRVELGEIEHSLRNHPLVSDSAVVLRREEGSEDQLVGFVTVRLGASSRIVEELHRRLSTQLPSYMIPQLITVLDNMPINENGKVDRRTLSVHIQPLAASRTFTSKEQPITDLERQMQGIWAQVLNIDASAIGLDDSFFQVGGNSITAMKVVSQTRKILKIDLSVAHVFQHDRLGELAAHCAHCKAYSHDQRQVVLVDNSTKRALLEEIDSLECGVSSMEISDLFPVTSFQERFIVEGRETGQHANYFYLDFDGDVQLQRLEDSCVATVRRFPILRERFLTIQHQTWQVVMTKQDMTLQVLDVEGDLSQAANNYCLEDIRKQSETDQHVAFAFLRQGRNGGRLIFQLSHAQYDGFSFPVILQSLIDSYNGIAHLPAKSFSNFLTYAAQQRRSSEEYWTKILRGSSLTVIEPYICPQGNLPKQSARVYTEVNVRLPCLPNKVTAATLLSAAWAILLSEITSQDDIVFGHLVSGRNSTLDRLEELVGPCVNIIPIRARISSFKSRRDLLLCVQKQFTAMGEADSMGFKEIVESCTDWATGTTFTSFLQHLNIYQSRKYKLAEGSTATLSFNENRHLVPTGLIIDSCLSGDSLQIRLLANTRIISNDGAQTLIERLSGIVSAFEREK